MCALFLTTTMSVGLGFGSHSLAMDDEGFKSNFSRLLNLCTEQLSSLKDMKNMSLRDVVINYILLDEDENNGEKLYILPMAEDQSKCMVVNENLTKCVYFSNQKKWRCSGKFQKVTEMK